MKAERAMLESLLTSLSAMLSRSPAIALAGAFLWGIASILLSPCHLSSIPLLIGYLTTHNPDSVGRAARLSLIFAAGVLISIAAIGAVTAAAGRIMGDLGRFGNMMVAIIFFALGLYLMDILPLNWSWLRKSTKSPGPGSALTLGMTFGMALGPCTFAFIAPVLGLVLARATSDLGAGMALLASFALGHCGVIVVAGAVSGLPGAYLNWTQNHPAVKKVRRLCGLLVVCAGVYLLSRY